MATRTVKVAGGNWSATGTWNEGIVPTAADDVVFLAGSGTLTIDGTSGSPSLCRSFDCTNFTGTLAHGAAAQLNIGDGTAGVFKLVSGMTYTPNATAVLKFVSTANSNCNITFAGKTFPLTTFDGVAGKWQFQDNALFQINSSSTVVLTNGTLDTNGKTITSGDFSSNNSNTRALTLGATVWTLSTNGGTTIWDVATSTGMTLTANTSTLQSASSTALTFAGGGLTYNLLTFTALGSNTPTISGANTFATLTLTWSGAAALLLAANQTVTGTLTVSGGGAGTRSFIRSSVRGTSRTLSAGTVTVQYLDLQDITGAGGGSWNLSAITGLSGDCGGNTNITFTTQQSNYWVPSAATSTGSFGVVTRWANASAGVAGTGRVPLPQDTCVFDAGSIDAGSRTITQNMVRIGAINWTNVTNTPAFAKTTACAFYGSIIMVSGMTNSGTNAYTYEGRGSSTLTTGTLTWTNPLIIDCVSGVGTLTQGDNLTSSSTLTMTTGTFAGASTYTATFTTMTLNGGTFTQTGTTTLSGALAFGGATFVQTQTITGATTLAINTNSVVTFDRNLTISSTMTIQGATINGAFTISGGTGITFSGTGVTLLARSMTFSGSTITINGSGSTYTVNAITGTGAITATTGTLNHYGTITANTNCLIVPKAESSFAFGG